MTVHAFVDESERNGTYLLCAAIVEPPRLSSLRKRLASLLMPGQRELHFKRERTSRQRSIADLVAQLPISVSLYSTLSTPRTAEQSRQHCMARLVEDLCERNAHRLVLDSRDECDRHDTTTIETVLRRYPAKNGLTYDHFTSQSDPLIWVADIAAWCYGANGDWRRRIMPIIDAVVVVQKARNP